MILLLAILVLGSAAAWSRSDAYILHSGDTDVTMASGSLSDIVALHHRLGDTSYLWVRLGAREYLIRDESILGEAVALWAPIQAMRPEQEALNDEEERLDARIDAIEDGKATAAPGELAALRARDDIVRRRERELDEREEAMEKVVETKLRQVIDQAIRNGRATVLR